MKKLWIIIGILRHTRSDRILITYVVFVLLSALLIMITEPGIGTYADALWYCYAVISTVGFGDVVVTSLLPKTISIVVTLFSMLVIAVITGVIVNYYNELLSRRREATLERFIDELEHLPELSHDELVRLSKQVKKFRGR